MIFFGPYVTEGGWVAATSYIRLNPSALGADRGAHHLRKRYRRNTFNIRTQKRPISRFSTNVKHSTTATVLPVESDIFTAHFDRDRAHDCMNLSEKHEVGVSETPPFLSHLY